jgi:hypothetical protein
MATRLQFSFPEFPLRLDQVSFFGEEPRGAPRKLFFLALSRRHAYDPCRRANFYTRDNLLKKMDGEQSWLISQN